MAGGHDDVPVLSPDGAIIGFLDSRRCRPGGAFEIHAAPIASVATPSLDNPPNLVETRAVLFEWHIISVARDNISARGAGRWRAHVLVANRPELLHLLPGFEFMAERYGEKVA